MPADNPRRRLHQLIVTAARLHAENTGDAGHEVADLHAALGVVLEYLPGDTVWGVLERELADNHPDWPEAVDHVEGQPDR